MIGLELKECIMIPLHTKLIDAAFAQQNIALVFDACLISPALKPDRQMPFNEQIGCQTSKSSLHFVPESLDNRKTQMFKALRLKQSHNIMT